MKMLCNVKRAWSKSGRARKVLPLWFATCGKKHDLPVNLSGVVALPGPNLTRTLQGFGGKREKKLGRGKRGRRVKKAGKKREEKGFMKGLTLYNTNYYAISSYMLY